MISWLILIGLLPAVVISFEDYSNLALDFGNAVREKFRHQLDDPITDELRQEINQIFQQAFLFDDENQRQKRDTTTQHEQLLLDGFVDVGSVPVDFARDICMFQVDGIEYAAALYSSNSIHQANNTRITIFRVTGNREFILIHDNVVPHIVSIDCLGLGSWGLVAIAVNISAINNNLDSAGLVLQIKGPQNVSTAHRNVMRNQYSVRLWEYGNDIFLIYTYEMNRNMCPIYKFTAQALFEIWTEVPCLHSIRAEPFTIRFDLFIGMANAYQNSSMLDAPSIIYKYDLNIGNFVEYQSLVTRSAKNIQSFKFMINNELNYFLIITTNSIVDANDVTEIQSGEYCALIIYKYVEEIFLPVQNIFVDTPTMVLPHHSENREMLLLIASESHPVEVYHYIGWRFEDTELTNEVSTFEVGVSSLRTYIDAMGEPTIVAANAEIYGNTPNLFKAHFRVNMEHDAYEEIMDWCELSKRELTQFPFMETLYKLDAVKTVQNIEGGFAVAKGITFGPQVHINGSKVRDVITGSKNKLEEDSHKISRMQETANLVASQVNLIEEKMALRLSKSDHLNVTGDVIVGHIFANETIADTVNLPGHGSRSSNPRSNEIVFKNLIADVVEADKINGQLMENLLQSTSSQYNLNMVKVPRLFVRHKIVVHPYEKQLSNALNINGVQTINTPATIDSISVSKLKLTGKMNLNGVAEINSALDHKFAQSHKIAVDKLFVRNVHGLINDVDFKALDDDCLKTIGDQYLLNTVSVGHLNVDHNTEAITTMNNRSLSDLEVIHQQPDVIFIDQDLKFNNRVDMVNLTVTERVDGIDVHPEDLSLNILLKRHTSVQHLNEMVVLDSVTLMDPITLHGKIPNSTLNQMNPNVVVSEDVEVAGDFTLNGHTIVKKQLQAHDLVSQVARYSLRRLKNYGINSNQIKNNITFRQPIKINSLTVESINDEIVMDKLVKDNLASAQVIVGTKTFAGSLLSGNISVKVINSINLDELQASIFQVDGPQNVTGHITFRRIQCHRVGATQVNHGGVDLSKYASRDSKLYVGGACYLGAELQVRSKLSVDNLYTDYSVFGSNITQWADDTVFRYETDAKVFGKLTFADGLKVNNLDSTGDWGKLIELPNDGRLVVDVDDWQSIELLHSNAIYFAKQMNGINAQEFGHNWLLYERDQIFTAHQKFTNLKAPSTILFGVVIDHKSQAYDMNGVKKNSYLINRVEEWTNVVFENGVKVQGNVTARNPVNNKINIPNDLITQEQRFINELYISANDVIVSKMLLIPGRLNSIPMEILLNFTTNAVTFEPQNLVIVGSAKLTKEPLIHAIGDVLIEQLHKHAWMTYNSVEINARFTHIGRMIQHSDVFVKGMFNALKLDQFYLNYFSLTKSNQRVAGKYTFTNDVVIHGKTLINELITSNGIRNTHWPHEVNVTQLAESSIKNQNGDQDLTGNWNIDELVIVNGDLNHIPINGLKLDEDLVHKHHPANNVTGQSTFATLQVQNVFCEGRCIVQGVDINEWFAKAVMLNANNKIQGRTILTNPTFRTNLKVFGATNGFVISEKDVMSKKGDWPYLTDLYLDNRRETMQLQSMSIVQLDLQQNLNGLPIGTAYQSNDSYVLATGTANVVQNNVIFQQALTADELHLSNASMFNLNGRDVQLALDKIQLVQRQLKYYDDLIRITARAKHASRAVVTGLKRIQSFPARLSHVDYVVAHSSVDGIKHCLAQVDAEMPSTWKLATYNEARNQFSEPFNVFDFHERITQMHSLFDDILFVQTIGRAVAHVNRLVTVDGASGLPRIHLEWPSQEAIQVEMINVNGQLMLIMYCSNCHVIEIHLITTSTTVMEWTKKDIQTIPKKTVKQISALGHGFAILMDKKLVDIWEWDAAEQLFKMKHMLPSVNPVAMTIVKYRQKHFVAVQCHTGENFNIDVFVIASHKVDHFQSIANEYPLQIRFSALNTGDLLLYILTTDPVRALVLYRYEGMSKFNKFDEYSGLGKGRYLQIKVIVWSRGAMRNFLLINSEAETNLLEVDGQ